MENASKALLIAASVLIAIILIAVGLKILGSTKGSVEQVDKVSNSMEVSVFNSNYTKYEGKQSASAVKSLLSLIATSNQRNNNRQISVNLSIGGENSYCETATEILNSRSAIQSSNIYGVSMGLNSNGYVSSITISDNPNQTGYYTIEGTQGETPIIAKPNYKNYEGQNKNRNDIRYLLEAIEQNCKSNPVTLTVKLINLSNSEEYSDSKIINDPQNLNKEELLNSLSNMTKCNIEVNDDNSKIIITGYFQ